MNYYLRVQYLRSTTSERQTIWGSRASGTSDFQDCRVGKPPHNDDIYIDMRGNFIKNAKFQRGVPQEALRGGTTKLLMKLTAYRLAI